MDFTENSDEMVAFINNIKANGGGDYPEDIPGGLKKGLDMSWKSEARFCVLICDAPCHGSKYHTNEYMGDDYPNGDPNGLVIEDLIKEYGKKGINFYGVKIDDNTDKMFQILNKSYSEVTDNEIVIADLKGNIDELEFFVSFGANTTLQSVTHNNVKVNDILMDIRSFTQNKENLAIFKEATLSNTNANKLSNLLEKPIDVEKSLNQFMDRLDLNIKDDSDVEMKGEERSFTQNKENLAIFKEAIHLNTNTNANKINNLTNKPIDIEKSLSQFMNRLNFNIKDESDVEMKGEETMKLDHSVSKNKIISMDDFLNKSTDMKNCKAIGYTWFIVKDKNAYIDWKKPLIQSSQITILMDIRSFTQNKENLAIFKEATLSNTNTNANKLSNLLEKPIDVEKSLNQFMDRLDLNIKNESDVEMKGEETMKLDHSVSKNKIISMDDFLKKSTNGRNYKAIGYTWFIVKDKNAYIDWKKPLIQSSQITTNVMISENPFSLGAMRFAYFMHDNTLNQKMVAKRSKCMKKSDNNLDYYKRDIESIVISQHIINEFNERVVSFITNTKNLLSFVHSFVYELEGGEYIWAENYIKGRYEKFNNNSGWIKTSFSESTLLAQAFSHFSWQYTKGYMIMVDIQGVDNMLTDPQIHCVDRHKFGAGNLGYLGIVKFFITHRCNKYCKQLGLVHPRETKLIDRKFDFFVDKYDFPEKFENISKICDLCKEAFKISNYTLYDKKINAMKPTVLVVLLKIERVEKLVYVKIVMEILRVANTGSK
eukprot:CAMPEP_0170536448 /NCGR_PEP_ID=MMETSP0209-20121228/102153_1 /TAXON_ID=665100 ORGANISM="Litonotus pictus, Strain P1" /NCGR_SAMPLE_ID=MMETSP0209 /ASSEMBLY_ACC=CAM_ASM_000301 /LENGTH=765 /DNA_ID=CAMNT_0010837817 /DNA_START=540 /DNA_END=2837 /DNA_ORIENTATION=+